VVIVAALEVPAVISRPKGAKKIDARCFAKQSSMSARSMSIGCLASRARDADQVEGGTRLRHVGQTYQSLRPRNRKNPRLRPLFSAALALLSAECRWSLGRPSSRADPVIREVARESSASNNLAARRQSRNGSLTTQWHYLTPRLGSEARIGRWRADYSTSSSGCGAWASAGMRRHSATMT
jgi:hypothetical protein